jgi:heavy metal sensor kinase
MQFFGQLSRRIHRLLDFNSLQVRLTVGIVATSTVGLGGVAIWTSWKMQNLLVSTHKQNVRYIADRFPNDVAHYSQDRPAMAGLQPAIDNLTAENVLLWVKRPDGTIAAQSMALKGRSDRTSEALQAIPREQILPQVHHINDRYFILCSNPLTVKGMNLGYLYVVQDITSDRTMFAGIVRSLSLASLVAIVLLAWAIAYYVRRSLSPLRQLSQLTETISADDLGQTQMPSDHAPTEVRELANTCNIMLERLSQSWEQQRQFVSNVSHELRTPLTLVSGYLQSTLRRSRNLSEPQREALEIAASEADRTIRLLQDLLDLARADRGYLHVRVESVVLNELVGEIVSMARQYSARAIELQADDRPIAAEADPNRLKQVLLNLIDNAVKYSPAPKPITVKVTHSDGEAIVQVRDRGEGIPLAQQTRIFERFYRCDEDRSRSTGGTGLGLSIVQTLVEGMGGNISVRSKLGEGSVFTVMLPLASDAALLGDRLGANGNPVNPSSQASQTAG